MKLLKLFFRFFQYLVTFDNPLPYAFWLLPLLAGLFITGMEIAYITTNVEERIDFLAYSPLPSSVGKLDSLAYFSALQGDVSLGRYLYQLSLYQLPHQEHDAALEAVLYPEKMAEIRLVEVKHWLSIYPTSRDLLLMQAALAKETKNTSLYRESVAQLTLLDPNNQFVLGLSSK